MTSDPRIDRLEGIVEELRDEVRALRTDMTSLRAEISSRLNTHLVVMIGLWATTIVAIVGLLFKG